MLLRSALVGKERQLPPSSPQLSGTANITAIRKLSFRLTPGVPSLPPSPSRHTPAPSPSSRKEGRGGRILRKGRPVLAVAGSEHAAQRTWRRSRASSGPACLIGRAARARFPLRSMRRLLFANRVTISPPPAPFYIIYFWCCCFLVNFLSLPAERHPGVRVRESSRDVNELKGCPGHESWWSQRNNSLRSP